MSTLQSRFDGIFNPSPVNAEWEYVDPNWDPRLRRGGKPGRKVDSQKHKLYAAEQVVRNHPKNKPVVSTYDPKKRAQMVRQVQAYADKLLKRAYIVRKYGTNKVRVDAHLGRKRAWAYSGVRVIELPLYGAWGWNIDVVLHEVAHVLAEKHYSGRDKKRSHDRIFCMIYLDLVRHVLGADVAKEFKASMRKHKVKFTKPREMTQEQRDAAAARLIAARAARQGIQVATL